MLPLPRSPSSRPSWWRRAELTGARLLIDQLQAQLAVLKRLQFGRSSEKLEQQITQLELMLEDLEEGEAERIAPAAASPRAAERRQPLRRPLPQHLPRETIIQAPAPDLPVEKGRPGPALIASVVTGKYIDGLPLYRQAGIIARDGVEIDRATLCDWVGHAAWWLAPVAEAIAAHVMAAPVIHTDDTPIGVLSPGRGKTKTGRFWTYVVDERSGLERGRQRPSTATARTARANGRPRTCRHMKG